MNSTQPKNRYLFFGGDDRGGSCVYFLARSPIEVKRKYPTLTYWEDESRFSEEILRKFPIFDIDSDPQTHKILRTLKQAADEFYASLGEQVRPPTEQSG
jgi:hypothetical protein